MGSVVMGGEASLVPRSHTTSEDIISGFIFTLCLLNLIAHCFADKTLVYTEIDGKKTFLQNLNLVFGCTCFSSYESIYFE